MGAAHYGDAVVALTACPVCGGKHEAEDLAGGRLMVCDKALGRQWWCVTSSTGPEGKNLIIVTPMMRDSMRELLAQAPNPDAAASCACVTEESSESR